MNDAPIAAVRGGRLVWVCPGGKILPMVGGGDGPTSVLDREIQELSAKIKDVEEKAAEKKRAVDEDRDKRRAEGKNILLDKDLFDDFDARYREADELKDEALLLRSHREAALTRSAAERGTSPGVAGEGRPLNRAERREFESIARRFVDSDVYKQLKASGLLETGGHINTDPVDVLERDALLSGLRQRTTVNVGDAGAVVPIDQQVWPPVEIPVRQVRLMDLISMVTTESDMVNFVQQTVRGDYAAPTPYGTAAPEADYEFALKQASVKRVPQFVPATKDVLADQGQLQGLLQDQLMYGVRLALELAFLAGNGTSGTDVNFQGILNAPGIGSITMGSSGHTSEYELDAIHRAITFIRLTLFADPTALLIHPTDYESTILRKDSYGRYLYPVGTETDTIWGLQPVISPVVAQGTALAGDFKQGARMWLRTGLSVTASTEHLDFFTRGMVAILAELRAAFAVIQPRAFCQILSIT
jgi:HK97 family phage major capsid protein